MPGSPPEPQVSLGGRGPPAGKAGAGAGATPGKGPGAGVSEWLSLTDWTTGGPWRSLGKRMGAARKEKPTESPALGLSGAVVEGFEEEGWRLGGGHSWVAEGLAGLRQARVRAQDLTQRVQRQRSVGGRGPRVGWSLC